MKLLNYSTTYFAVPLLAILSVWAAIFYLAMLDEIYDSLGDVLEHQKMVVIQKAAADSTVLQHSDFDDRYYTIQETTAAHALNFKDRYLDTLLYLQVEEDYEPIRMLITMFQQNGRYYELRVITSMVEEDDLIDELLYSLIYLYTGLLATILLLNNFILKRIWKPFYTVLSKLKDFKLDSPAPLTLPQTNVDEFRLLNQTIERLLDSNLTAYNRQKQFIENASHELQTPLAISRNKLELLAETPNLTAEQAGLLQNALNNLNRMARLNKSLLLITKIENKQFTELKQVNVSNCIRQILDDLKEQLEYRHITATVNETAPCLQPMNPDLADMLFQNLVKNALVHNKEGGFINITLHSGSVTFENSGQDGPLNKKEIFTRFNKNSTSNLSTGLGLSIVKAIADLYHFQVDYRFQGRHIFSVKF